MNPYNKLNQVVIDKINQIKGIKVLFDEQSLQKYSHDETEDLVFMPEMVVIPNNVTQISELLKICNEHIIPVTPRGAGTGLSGGALPVYKGIILSMEHFNKILHIDEKNFQVTVEPGVITEELQNAVKEKGLFYPPDPASKGSCFIGGNLAENSGGPKAVKYGVTYQYVLNLEVVLPTGEVIWTGANVLKNATGYNLTQLMIGSEGTLGIITKAVLRLIPYPKFNLLLLAPFKSLTDAGKAVNDIFLKGIIPSAMELMEKDAFELGVKFLNEKNPFEAHDNEAFLLIEVDGNDLENLYKEIEGINVVLETYKIENTLFADGETQKEQLWKIRRVIGEAVKKHSIYKEEDTVVPRGELPTLLEGVKQIGAQYGFKSICYGHAGDGNLHVNIIKGNMSDEAWNKQLKKGINEIFKLCKRLGGTISGEHGIGWVQKDYLPIVFEKSNINLQKQIKKLFDPNMILNPGKIFN